MKMNKLTKLSAILTAAIMSVSAAGITVSAAVKTDNTSASISDSYSKDTVLLKSQNAKPGEIVEVPLVLYTNNKCTSYAILVEYDSRLELVETDGVKMSTDFEQDGKKYVSLVSYDSEPFIDGENTATIKFRISDNAENDKYSVKFSEITTLSGEEGDISSYDFKNAYITVTGGIEKKKGNCIELLSVTGMKGGSAVVQLIPNSNNECSSYSILIEYDSRLLLEDRDVAGANTFNIYQENGKSYVAVVGYISSNYVDGEAMAALNFHIPDDATPDDNYEVKIAEVSTFQSAYSAINNYTTSDAIISIAKSSRSNDKFSDLMTFQKFDKLGNIIASGVGYRGDSNGDGKADITDAALIARCIAGRKMNKIDDMGKFFGDVNQDGIVDIRDAAAIARYIAKGKVTWDNVLK